MRTSLLSVGRFVLVVCLLIATTSTIVHSVELQCNYGYRLDHGYPCQITKGRLELEDDNEVVTFVGKHQAGRDDNDLKLISFVGSHNLRLHVMPSDAFKQFPQLNDFSLQHCQLRKLKKGDFSKAGNLKNLNLDSNDLRRLNSTIFEGAYNLEWLSLSSNFIENIHKDAFHGLSNLKMLILSQNKLHDFSSTILHPLVELREILLDGNGMEILPAGLFDQNLQMKRIWLQKNQLRVIDPKVFAPLEHLTFINLEENVCVNEVFREQYRETEKTLTEALQNCNPTREAVKN